ncbi:MAG: hypothetical protein ABSH44_18280 [Bryobacteraceae bacterium]|jgi:hypothetical protein
MKTLAWILLPLLCAAADAPVGIDALLDAARAAPPEFAADATIRIAALDKLEKPRRIELLEQAFRRASGAQQPYKRHAAFARPGSPSGFLNHAYGQDLDAMSLRLRAIETLLPLDGKKARELFLQAPPPRTPRLKCDDFLVYDAGRFYDVLGSIARQSFTAREVQGGEPFRLLRRFAGDLASPVQVAAVARMLAAANVKDADFQALVNSFAEALGKISGDDRSFAYSMPAGKQILALVEECKRRHASPLPLLEAYRLYLVNHLSAGRCADDDSMLGNAASFGFFAGQAIDQQAQDAVALFNESLRMAPLQPIQEQEATPSRLEGVAAGLRSCEDAECHAIAEQYRELVFGPDGSAYPPDQKYTPAWRGRLRNLLSALAGWQESAPGAHPSNAEHFRMKSTAYGDLLNLVSNSPDRELVFRAMLDCMKHNRFQEENRMEWFLPVNSLIGRAAMDPLGMERLADLLRKVDDPIIALYANLETVAPRAPERILPLL